jgi:hypothetical protein
VGFFDTAIAAKGAEIRIERPLNHDRSSYRATKSAGGVHRTIGVKQT